MGLGIHAEERAAPQRVVLSVWMDCRYTTPPPDRIDAAQPCANVADDPARTFEIDPAALIAAERVARSGGKRLMGYYHSHPNGRAEPSPRDAIDAARDDRLWLIVAGDRITAWRASAHGALHGAFDPVEILLPAS